MQRTWTEFFASLPASARILEVASGTAGLIGLARETAAARSCEWELCSCDPKALASLEQSRFDAICGQYVLERGEAAAALTRVFGLLKPRGDAQFVLHHRESIIAYGARQVLHEADLIFKQTRIYRRLHRLVTMDQPGNNTQRATDELRAAIQALKQALAQAQALGVGRLLSTALGAVQQLLTARKHMRPTAAGLEVDRAEEALRAVTRRMHELVEQARSAEDMAVLQQQAATAGFTLIETLPQLHSAGQLVGWQLLMHRP